jgi:hypothetical protein
VLLSQSGASGTSSMWFRRCKTSNLLAIFGVSDAVVQKRCSDRKFLPIASPYFSVIFPTHLFL